MDLRHELSRLRVLSYALAGPDLTLPKPTPAALNVRFLKRGQLPLLTRIVRAQLGTTLRQASSAECYPFG